MSETKLQGIGTAGQFLLLIIIVIVVIFLLLVDNGADSRNELERTRPVSGLVTWENSICSNTLCRQELTVKISGSEISVSHRLNKSFKVGDTVKLVKVFKERSALFSVNKFGDRYNYYYEVFPPNS